MFLAKKRQDSQNMNNDTFFRAPARSAQCIIGTEKYPDAGILLNYDDDDYTQGYEQPKRASRALTKVDIPQLYISDIVFRSSKNGRDKGYLLYNFDIRYQKT